LTFGAPLLLLTLLVIPAFAALRIVLARRSARYPIAFTNLPLLAEAAEASHVGSVRRLVPIAMLLLALAVAGAALARPEVGKTVVQKQSVVVMLVDLSGSMEATDVKPTRIAAAIQAMQGFVHGLPSESRIGLVSFSSQPTVIAIPTTDHESIAASLPYLAPNGATALGDGLSAAVTVVEQSIGGPARLARSAGTPGAIVLLSDGAQNRGTIQPDEAARRAKAAGVPVYTIAYGTPHGTVRFEGYPQKFPAPPDPATMRSIASITGGKTFSARSATQVVGVFKNLGSVLGRRHEERKLGSWFDLVAGFALLGAALSARAFGPIFH
jgi:Ca-activated chloride channel family protein